MNVRLDGNNLGYEYEGVGGINAGAGMTLLEHYPEPYRGWIFDLLFKPKYGMGLNYLKMEIGGDVNSSSGCEPAVFRTKAEYDRAREALQSENPRGDKYRDVREMFRRGYQLWFATEANKRLPGIPLDGLQWGAPRWVGGENGSLLTEENIRYIATFIKGVKVYWNLDFAYIAGNQNEVGYTAEYIKALRRILDEEGLSYIKIVVADLLNFEYQERLHKELAEDKELADAVDVIGSHYTSQIPAFRDDHDKARVWVGEDGFWGEPGQENIESAGPFNAGGDVQPYSRIHPTIRNALFQGHKLNMNYIERTATKSNLVNIVMACGWYNTTPDCAYVAAHEPWSGHFDIPPMFWAVAHHTQFAGKNWRFLSGEGCGTLPGGGSYVTVASPEGGDFSVMIETYKAKEPQAVTFITKDLSKSAKHVWETFGNSDETWFKETNSGLAEAKDAFTLTLEPNRLYTITTTAGQRKGTDDMINGRKMIEQIPPSKGWELPFIPDFTKFAPNRMAPLFTDIHGIFDVRRDGDSPRAGLLRQTMTRRALDWPLAAAPPLAFTLFGDHGWTDYRVSMDAKTFGETDPVLVGGRGHTTFGTMKGYFFQIMEDNAWALYKNTAQGGWAVERTLLAEGVLPEGFVRTRWNSYAIAFKGETVEASINGKLVSTAVDGAFRQGAAVVGCGFCVTDFTNIMVG